MTPVKKTSLSCRQLRFFLPLALALMLTPFESMSAGLVSAEAKIKAALIYKLTRFVEWPENTHRETPDEFGICLLGRDDFGKALDTLAGRKVGIATISILRFKQSTEIDTHCQLVFISDSKHAFLEAILDGLGQQPILTIGDSAGFAEKGGMIQLTYSRKRIGFKINLRRANATNLKIAAPLLELSTIIEPDRKGVRK